MSFEVETPAETQAKVRIRVPQAAIDEALAHELGHMQERARVPGFRPGKVPKQILQKKFGDSLVKEVRRRLVAEAFEEGLTERKLHPVDAPALKDEDLEPKADGSLAIDLEFEVIPHVEPTGYDRFDVTLPPIEIKETDVAREVEGLRRQAATAEEVADGITAAGDIVVADLTLRFLDGTELPKFEDRIIDTGAGMVDGVASEEAKTKFVGCRRGDVIKLTMKLPPEFPIEEHRGKTAVSDCAIKDVRRFKLPEVSSPDFLARFGAKDLDDLSAKVRERLGQYLRAEQDRNLEERCVDELIERNKFTLPAGFLQRRIDAERDRIRRDLTERGTPADQVETQILEHEGQIRNGVERRLRESFLLDRIAETLETQVSTKELEQQFVLMARAWQVEPQKLFEQFESQGLVQNVVGDIRRAKVRRKLREAVVASENESAAPTAAKTKTEDAQ